MNHESLLFEHLVEALRLVAADWERQKQILPEFVCIPDEIALIYANAVESVEQMQGTGLVTQAQAEKLKELDSSFENMSSEEELWTLDALSTRSEWASVRAVARELLAMLGRTQEKPSLESLGLSYVQSDGGTSGCKQVD